MPLFFFRKGRYFDYFSIQLKYRTMNKTTKLTGSKMRSQLLRMIYSEISKKLNRNLLKCDNCSKEDKARAEWLAASLKCIWKYARLWARHPEFMRIQVNTVAGEMSTVSFLILKNWWILYSERFVTTMSKEFFKRWKSFARNSTSDARPRARQRLAKIRKWRNLRASFKRELSRSCKKKSKSGWSTKLRMKSSTKLSKASSAKTARAKRNGKARIQIDLAAFIKWRDKLQCVHRRAGILVTIFSSIGVILHEIRRFCWIK